MKKLFIIPFELPWDWTADYQRQTIFELNKNNNKVLAYMNKDSYLFLKVKQKKNYPNIKNTDFYQPRNLLPFQRFELVQSLNQLINLIIIRLKNLNKKIYLWSFDPDFYLLNYLARFLGIITIYDCVDYHSHNNQTINQQIRTKEDKIIKNSKYFFVNSRELAKIHSKKRKPTAIVPQGFDLTTFETKLKKLAFFNKIKKPIIGYVGGINYRLDYDLLIKLAKNNPNWQFVFWGPIQKQDDDQQNQVEEKQRTLFSLANVSVSQSERKNIPAVINHFDVCLIPYKTNYLFNKHCYPMKIFEYFYLKKPIISAPINELKRFPEKLISIAKDYSSWQKKIEEKIEKKELDTVKKTKQRLAFENSWKNKISNILEKIN
ncbi:MAG: glycosyltransferase [Patescibacteria group bacterium]